MIVSATTWTTLSKLLDEALDLEPPARAVWFERLSATQPEIAPSVRKLLAAHASSETADVLARLPTLALGSDPAVRSASLTPGDRIGPYRLKREIGTGGMADVWLAERADGAFARDVALKLPMIQRLRRDLALRFARERDILARLEHPNIARLYDAGIASDGLPYLAMEYVDGRPITEYCDSHRLGVPQRLRLFAQVLDAVQYAHASLVIHRDIKPSNILVSASGDVRLLDFGIAKLLVDDDTALETQLTQMSGRALTPDYASPEQIKGEPLTIATDVYSLGVVLYELLAGSRPYRLKLKSIAHLEQAIVTADPQRPSALVTERAAQSHGLSKERLARSLTGDLDAITLKALEKIPKQRYATIGSFAEDLHRHLSGRPIHARRASWAYRAQKYVVRNKLPVGAVISTVAALVAGVVIALWQATEARTQALAAQREANALSVVSSFMLEAFSKVAAAPSIAKSGGQEIMSETLKAALASTQARHGSEPKALAAVYGTASSMFVYIQRQPEAMDAALKQLQYLKDASEPTPLIAGAYRQIALSHYRKQEYDAAIEKLQSGIDVLGSDRSAAVRLVRGHVLRLLANVYETQGRLSLSQQTLEKAREQFEPDLQLTNQYYGAALLDLARVKAMRGEEADALSLIEKTRSVFVKLPGLRDSEWGGLEHITGSTALQLGQYERAEVAFKKSAEFYGREFGRDGPNAAGIDALIAAAALRRGNFVEAEQLLARSEKVFRRRTDDSNQVLAVRTQLSFAELYLETGDLKRTDEMLKELRTRKIPQPLLHARFAMLDARYQSEVGHYAEALAILEALESTHRSSLSEAARIRQSLDLLTASIYLDSGDTARAGERLAVLDATQMTTDDSAQNHRAKDLRSALNLIQRNGSDSANTVKEFETRFDDPNRRSETPRIEATARIAFARALLAGRRPTDAKSQLQFALTLLDTQAPSSPLRSSALAWLALSQSELGDSAAARVSFDAAEKVLAENAAVGDHYKQPLLDVHRRLNAASGT